LKDGANVKTSAEATLGGAKVQVSVDKNGVHETAGLGTDANKDTKLGASLKLGIGVGVSLNLSQAQRALINTGNAVQDATRNALDRVLPGWESKFEQDGQQH